MTNVYIDQLTELPILRLLIITPDQHSITVTFHHYDPELTVITQHQRITDISTQLTHISLKHRTLIIRGL